MTTPPARPTPPPGTPTARPVATGRVVVALLARDLTVLRTRPAEFVARTVVQPLMLLFVLGYVAPLTGSGSSVGAATTLVAGMVAMVVLFQGLFAVAMPLVQEFGVTREIDDRVLAPVPVAAVALAKVLTGAVQGLLAAVVVFPLAELVPASRPDLLVSWPVLVTVAPLATVTCSALGLYLGCALDPRGIAAVLAILLTPLMYLGCTLYPWSALDDLRWVQVLALLNPLTYVSEGFRAALTPADHLGLPAVYGVLVGSAALLLWRGVRRFEARVVG